MPGITGMNFLIRLLFVFVLFAVVVQPGVGLTFEIFAHRDGVLYRIETTDDYLATAVGSGVVAGGTGGLEFSSDGELFLLTTGGNSSLYTVDPGTGSTSLVGGLGTSFLFEGGLGFDPTDGTLYAVNLNSASNPTLATIDTSTGLATEVGPIGSGSHDFLGLVFEDDGTMFGVDRVTNALWRIDKNNPGGPGTQQIGSSFAAGIDVGVGGGMAVGPGGIVYCYVSGSSQLLSIDLTTGEPEILHSYPPLSPQFYGLAIESNGSGFIRGDTNQDGGFDVSDIVFLLASLFVPGGPIPGCADAADLNDDGGTDVSDAVFGLMSLFVPGSAPVPLPGPGCGVDPTMDTLDCAILTCP